jgi:peptide/nickel transport system permease protein
MRKLKIGVTIVGAVTLLALFAPLVAKQDPRFMSLPDRLESPSRQHLLGRDENGADVFAKLVYGSRVSLGVAWSVVLISASIGLLVGSAAGYRGGWADQLLMRITDMFYAFPGFLIALALVAVLGPSVFNLILAMCVTSWTGFARLVRGEVLHLKERDHVQSARAVGAGALRIMTKHIWPNLISLVVIQATFAMAGTIIAEAGLSFLGLGVPGHTPTWGALLNSGRRVMTEAPHISLAPGVAIVTLVLGFNMLGDGLRDYLDPRRARARR